MTMTLANVAYHLIYGGEGLVMTLGNGLLLVTILCDKSLKKRKEMLIVAGLIGADLIFGLAALLLAIYRFIIQLMGLQLRPATTWDCVILPPLFLTVLGSNLNAIMSLVVSIDRYLAVAYPIFYRNKLGVNYSTAVLLCVGGYGMIVLAGLFTSTYFNATTYNSTMTLMCYETVTTGWFAIYLYSSILLVGVLSVFIYISAFFRYISTRHKIASVSSGDQAAMLQRRLTVTLGIITISTLIFFIGPYFVFAISAWRRVPAPLPTMLGNISRFSTIINIIIYVVRQTDIREAIKKIFKRKAYLDTARTAINA